MAKKKDYLFKLLLPLSVSDITDRRTLEAEPKLLSFSFDFEHKFCKIFVRSKNDKMFFGTSEEWILDFLEDKDFKFYISCLSECINEGFVNGLSQENEKKLEPKKFSARSRSKKNKLG